MLTVRVVCVVRCRDISLNLPTAGAFGPPPPCICGSRARRAVCNLCSCMRKFAMFGLADAVVV